MELRQVLPAEPSSAGIARRLAADTLNQWHRERLVEVTALLVSELVTNALLHAGSDIALRILLRGQAVRVEVRDASPVLPDVRRYGDEAATGRGLAMVQMLARRWGADPEPDGKVVWFEVSSGAEPSAGAGQDAGPPETRAPSPPATPAATRQGGAGDAPAAVRLLDVPVTLYRATQQHSDALLREHTLMALGAASGQAADAAAVATYGALTGPAQSQVRTAAEAGESRADLVLSPGPAAGEGGAALLALLDEADELSQRGELLTPAALPEIRAFRRWLLTELVAQLDGAAPIPWSAQPRPAPDAARAPLARIEHATLLDQLGDAIVIGDDGNRIAHVNAAAERLLGWPRGELVGRRLTTIVPERLREAHVAGFTRYLVGHEPRLLGRPVRVAARRRDGSEVPVELLLTAFRTPDGRQAFTGTLRDLSGRAEAEGENLTGAVLEALAELVAALRTPPASFPEAAARLLATIGGHCRCQVGAAWEREPEGERLRCVATWEDGSRDHRGFLAASSGQRFACGAGLPGRAWQAGQPVWVRDVVAVSDLPRGGSALEHGLRGAFALPVLADGRLLGVIDFFTERLQDPDRDLQAAMATLGQVLGSLLR